MTILLPEEYDISYFDGKKQMYRHNAGYSSYERWYRNEGNNSQGEFFRDTAKVLFDRYQLVGKKVLEIGCAKGFIVKDLRIYELQKYYQTNQHLYRNSLRLMMMQALYL